MNKVILLGNVTRDPELRYTPQQLAILSFGMATNEKYKDKETTEFHNCVLFGPRAEKMKEYIHKGGKLFVMGKLRTSAYKAKTGEEKFRVEVIVDEVEFAGAKAAAPSSTQSDYVRGMTQEVFGVSEQLEDLPF